MNINEIFGPTIQGEGKYTGAPSVFIRLNGCNLCCAFQGGSTCDTPYTSINPEKSKVMTTNEVIKSVKELLKDAVADTCHIVITGGEPLCQQDSLIDLIAGMRSQGMWNPITIETNGTLVPLSKLLLDSRVFWSVSPKLSTSCHFEGTDIPKARQEAHKSKRINLDALATIIYENTNDYQLKFVYSGEDSLSEIYDIIARLNDALIDRYGTRAEYCVECLDQHIMLMPEGAAIQQLEAKSKETVDACIRTGWKFCDRLHIRIWNDKRGV